MEEIAVTKTEIEQILEGGKVKKDNYLLYANGMNFNTLDENCSPLVTNPAKWSDLLEGNINKIEWDSVYGVYVTITS